jgi:uncharacterized RDD family membrane protein YckC
MNEPNDSTVAAEPSGFWRRVGAFCIDGLILGIVGLALAFTARDALSQIGVWGRLLGFVIALVYFGLLNSRIGGGQSPGKRLLGIKVVDRAGTEISVGRSFLRSVILEIPWFLNGAVFPGTAAFSFWLFPLAIAVFGAGLSILYLLVFNRPYRQSLHDLAVGSFVVRAPVEGSIGPARTWRPHLVVCAVLFIGSGLTPVVANQLAQGKIFGPMLDVHRAVSADPDVIHALVNRGVQHSGGNETSYFVVQAQVRDRQIGDRSRALRLAKLALKADPSIRELDLLQVTVVHGFDIGIASSSTSHVHSFDPAQPTE